MLLFGLSHLDTLLSLLLVELTWWGLVFFEQYLWGLIFQLEHFFRDWSSVSSLPQLHHERHMFDGDIHIEEIYFQNSKIEGDWKDLKPMLVFGTLLLLRLKAPFLLLVTVLKNKANQHCQLLKIWHGLTIILDLAILACMSVLHGMSMDWRWFLENGATTILPFFIFRLVMWNVAKTTVDELCTKENTLFVVAGVKGLFSHLGSNVKSALGILLSWEIFMNILLFIASVLYVFRDQLHGSTWNVLPNPMISANTGLLEIVVGSALNLMVIVLASLQLNAVNKDRKLLAVFLLILYILVGIIGYIAFHLFMLMQAFGSLMDENSVTSNYNTNFVAFGITVVIEILQLLPRLFIVEFTFQFLTNEKSKGSDTGDMSDKEMSALCQPLLRDGLTKGKEAE